MRWLLSLPCDVNNTVLSCPVLSYPILSCPDLFCSVLSCPVLSCPVLSYPIMSCPVLSCPALSPPLPSPPLPCPLIDFGPRDSYISSQRFHHNLPLHMERTAQQDSSILSFCEECTCLSEVNHENVSGVTAPLRHDYLFQASMIYSIY